MPSWTYTGKRVKGSVEAVSIFGTPQRGAAAGQRKGLEAHLVPDGPAGIFDDRGADLYEMSRSSCAGRVYDVLSRSLASASRSIWRTRSLEMPILAPTWA
jgi:hypothetical protein